MIYISNNNELNSKTTSNSKELDKKESQYLLRVIYDTEDKNVHKLLEGIFGPDQMLNVKNGKIAKINSSLTPKERDCFLGMVSEALSKMETEDTEEVSNVDAENSVNIEEQTENRKSDEEVKATEEEHDEEEKQTSRKVSAEKLIQEFASFLNNIS